MKINLLLLNFCLLAVLFITDASAQQKKPRIGIAGIQIENSVFMPNRQAITGKPSLPAYLSKDSVMGQSAIWLPSLIGGGSGRGPITRESFEAFVNSALEIIRSNMPYDAFWFYNHGACSVEGVDDPEGEFMERVRAVIGNDALVTTTMDLHGNVSWRVALYSDLITTYRKAPHDDAVESHRRGVVNLLERLSSGKGRPAYKAWVAVPVLLSGEWTSTRVEPAKSLYAMVPEVESLPGVVDAGIWIGYVWGDERRNQGVVMVVGDDEGQVESGAKKLAQRFWDVRRQFSLEAPGYPLEKCLDQVLKRPEFKTPKGKSLLYCSIPGSEMVEAARKAGIGGQAEAFVGAMTDNSYEAPVRLSGTVIYVSPVPVNDQQSESKSPPNRKRPDIAIIKTGSIFVVVGTSSPTPNLAGTGIDPKKMDIIMVKQGYLVSQWYDMQADWVMAQTRGSVDQDFKSLPYKRVVRPIFPLDPDMPDPELNVIIVPSAKQMYGR